MNYNTDLIACMHAVFVISVLRLVCAGAYHKRLASLPCLLSRFSSDLEDDGIRRKLHENLWYSIWHSMSFCGNLIMLLRSKWFLDLICRYELHHLYYDVNKHSFEPNGRFYYLCSLGFWTSCMLFLCIETIRKDFTQMILHHSITIGLMTLSFIYNYHRFGLLVLLLHDVVDVFLYIAKCMSYKKYTKCADISFALFAAAFFLARLVLYPVYCIYPAFYSMWVSYGSTDAILPYILPVMLACLYGLQVRWWLMIWNMIGSMKVGGRHVEKDCRSDEEKED